MLIRKLNLLMTNYLIITHAIMEQRAGNFIFQ